MTHSPRNVVVGCSLNHNEHFEIPHCDCAQVHKHEEPHNSMKERMSGAILLGPIDNLQGGHKFMSPCIGELI